MRGYTLALSLSALLSTVTGVWALPAELPFEGQLTNARGQPIEGEITLELALFAAEEGGEALGGWSERHALTLNDGQVRLVLGAQNPLPIDELGGPRWLELTVIDAEGSERLPRLSLGGAPYALRAAQAESLSDAALRVLTEQGIAGPEGPRGEPGPAGPMGPQGPAGEGITPGMFEALESRLWCLEHCHPSVLGGCRARSCDGAAHVCDEGEAVVDGIGCIAEGRVGLCLSGDCCVPQTCAELGRACGDWDDGCGGFTRCGDCSSGVCFGGACCQPMTCADLGRQCGEWGDDGCGGIVQCGDCGSGDCNAEGQCACSGKICPKMTGFNFICNAQAHCEYTPVDPSGWRAHNIWIWVPPGSFMMGAPIEEADSAPNDRPVHQVTFAEGYFVAKYELTSEIYQACEDTGACVDLNQDDTARPQVNIDWNEAIIVCNWLGGRLGSHSEWENAASGPVHRLYPWGNAPASCEYAVMNDGLDGCGQGRTWDVGSKPAGVSYVGALDMAGNVREWVEDCWHTDYNGAPTNGGAWTEGCSSGANLFPGGGFNNTAPSLRTAGHTGAAPSYRNDNVGTRCFRSPPGQ
ncbi:SUMF1/EgtB/PvdO family nonheme iron enzyme [Myxococcota bacterium]|nr:SUMF1/EgtB/PvdO family nonheme iron enzyme [Myxococcota bacterium]MBU1896863.1 SUMF1/EgtB/PvdO family nonheme iron enzyme [Myxococcota bacterium]